MAALLAGLLVLGAADARALDPGQQQVSGLRARRQLGKLRLSYFANSHPGDVQKFLDATRALPRAWGLERMTYRFEARGQHASEAERLNVNAAYIPPPKGQLAERVVFITAGVHGPENSLGSALQDGFLRETLQTLRASGALDRTAVVLAHGLNAWGATHGRRTGSGNADLNRSYDTLPNNADYEPLAEVLGPGSEPARAGLRERIRFVQQLTPILKRLGPRRFMTGVAGGQNSHPDGLFYSEPDPRKSDNHRQLLTQLLQDVHAKTPEAKLVLSADLHSGAGGRGVVHVYVRGKRDGGTRATQLEKLFAGAPLQFLGTDAPYQVKGDLMGFVEDFYRDKGTAVLSAALEIGTNEWAWAERWAGRQGDSWLARAARGVGRVGQQWKMLDTLHRMVVENRGFHNGYATPADEARSKRQFAELFNPSSPRFRKRTVDEVLGLLHTVTERFSDADTAQGP